MGVEEIKKQLYEFLTSYNNKLMNHQKDVVRFGVIKLGKFVN